MKQKLHSCHVAATAAKRWETPAPSPKKKSAHHMVAPLPIRATSHLLPIAPPLLGRPPPWTCREGALLHFKEMAGNKTGREGEQASRLGSSPFFLQGWCWRSNRTVPSRLSTELTVVRYAGVVQRVSIRISSRAGKENNILRKKTTKHQEELFSFFVSTPLFVFNVFHTVNYYFWIGFRIAIVVHVVRSNDFSN